MLSSKCLYYLIKYHSKYQIRSMLIIINLINSAFEYPLANYYIVSSIIISNIEICIHVVNFSVYLFYDWDFYFVCHFLYFQNC